MTPSLPCLVQGEAWGPWSAWGTMLAPSSLLPHRTICSRAGSHTASPTAFQLHPSLPGGGHGAWAGVLPAHSTRSAGMQLVAWLTSASSAQGPRGRRDPALPTCMVPLYCLQLPEAKPVPKGSGCVSAGGGGLNLGLDAHSLRSLRGVTRSEDPFPHLSNGLNKVIVLISYCCPSQWPQA